MDGDEGLVMYHRRPLDIKLEPLVYDSLFGVRILPYGVSRTKAMVACYLDDGTVSKSFIVNIADSI